MVIEHISYKSVEGIDNDSNNSQVKESNDSKQSLKIEFEGIFKIIT